MDQRGRGATQVAGNEPIEVGGDFTEQELLRRKEFLEFREEDVANLAGINDVAQRYASQDGRPQSPCSAPARRSTWCSPMWSWPGGRSGVDLARWLRERRPDVRVLLSSGFADIVQDEAAVGLRACIESS